MMPVSRSLGHEIAMLAWFVLAHLGSGWVIWVFWLLGVGHCFQSLYYSWRENENRT